MMLAVQMQGVCVAWQVYSLTKDPLSLGLIGFYSVLPTIVLSLFAGHFTDRLVRRNLLLVAQVVEMGCLLMLLWGGGADWSLVARVNLIYSAVFLGGVARAFLSPAQFAFFSEIVPADERVQGTAWSSNAWQIAAAGGPALGGLIYGLGGVRAAYSVAVGLLAAAFACVYLIPARERPRFDPKEPFVKSLLTGLRFVFGERLMLSALSLDLFAVLFGGAVALLPVFADRLGVGPEGLGVLRAAPFAGASVMGLFLAHRPPRKRSGAILLGCVASYGACIIGFGLSHSFVLSLALLALSGAFDNISVVVRGTLMQLLTPDSMRGRVSAVNQIFIASSNEVGELESGFTAKWMGAQPAVLFGGVMTLLVVAGIAAFSPRMRRLDIAELERKVEG